MNITYGRKFKKMFKKQPKYTQNKFEDKIIIFTKNIYSPSLRNHALSGEWTGYKSIDITGDTRACFEDLGDDNFEFVAIGSHSELYS